MKVLALNGDVNSCVASVRALATAGYYVVVGAPQQSSKAAWSRFAAGSFEYPSPKTSQEAFIARIVEEVAKDRGTFILPLSEPTSLALSAARERIFAAGGRLVMPPHDCLLRAHDKHQMTALAKSLGIAVPASYLITGADAAQQVAHTMRYPIVLKAPTSERMMPDGTIRPTGKPQYARNPQQFAEAYADLSRTSPGVLAQEFIEGTGSGYFALMHQGELRAEFAHQRLRDVDPTGSASCLRQSVKPSPALRKASLAMLQALNYHGAAMVEYRITADGTPYFLEINPRLWGSLALAIYAGVNFPALLARMAEVGDVAPQFGYREGVRCRWFLGDCRHLVAVMKGKPRGYPGRFPGRLETLLSFFRPVRGTYHDPFWWRDPLPEVADWLHSAKRALARRAGDDAEHLLSAGAPGVPPQAPPANPNPHDTAPTDLAAQARNLPA